MHTVCGLRGYFQRPPERSITPHAFLLEFHLPECCIPNIYSLIPISLDIGGRTPAGETSDPGGLEVEALLPAAGDERQLSP